MKIKTKVIVLTATALLTTGLSPVTSHAELPAGDYIVMFDNQANENAEAAKARSQGADIRFTYSSVFKGIAGSFNAAQINALQRNPRVKLIEADSVVSTETTTQTPAWGLDRIDQLSGTNGTFSYTATGAGVFAYIIDTGIAKHSEFGNRLQSYGFTAFKDKYGFYDCAGHGTHVAGTVGGSTYGVAKAVNLVAVRVLSCQGSGTNSGVIAGIEWVIKDHLAKNNLAVANMSLGGGYSNTLNTAVAKLFDNGITISVAAGNSNVDAINSSPASEPKAITVGATDLGDKRASYSNYGSSLDLFAPGTGILSANFKGGSTTMSGTSMATPHVTGVAALFLSQNTTANPSQVATAIVATATPDKISDPKGSTNKLLFTNL